MPTLYFVLIMLDKSFPTALMCTNRCSGHFNFLAKKRQEELFFPFK